MAIIFISEHYFPRIGGVSTYVRNMVHYSSLCWPEVTLMIPHEGKTGQIVTQNKQTHKEIWIGVGTSLTGNIVPQTRKKFISLAFDHLKHLCSLEKIEAIHLLFGLYTMQYFDFRYFRNTGIKCGVTIHNVPPAECGTSWKGDFFITYLKDKVRKIGVQLVNKQRIQKQKFDYYIVPSQHVKNLLQPVTPWANIHVISHGIDTKKERFQTPSHKKAIQVLCVGGFVPHKRQDVLVDVAALLRDKGFHIHWILVGPVRNKPYFHYITDKLSLVKDVSFEIKEFVPEEELCELYTSTDIYLQPSSEEGFCLTALDAASYGLPIVATLTGALPEIIRAGSGIVSDSDVSSIAEAIQKVILSLDGFRQQAHERIQQVRSQFNWLESAKKLKKIIEGTR